MKCYCVYSTEMEQMTETELSGVIDRYGCSGYPIYVNGYTPLIIIYTAVVEECALLIGCKVYDDKDYTVDDIKRLNKLGLVGKKIYDKCTMEL